MAVSPTITFQTLKIDAKLWCGERKDVELGCSSRWRAGTGAICSPAPWLPHATACARVCAAAHSPCKLRGRENLSMPLCWTEPCTRRFAILAMRHPSASRHAQCCRKVEDDPAKLYDLIACAHELVDLQKQLSRVEHAMICSCNARSRRGGTGQTCSVQGKPQQPTKLPRAKGWRKWPVTASCSQKCLRLCSS